MKRIIVSALVLFGVIIGLLLLLNQDGGAPANQANNVAVKSEVAEAIALVVTPQLVGTKANIAKVSLAEPGFVMVREVINGKLGQILEVSDYLTAGVYSDLEISLLTVPDDRADVIAVLYQDDGDEGFGSALDKIVYNQGVPVARSFSTGQPVLPNVFSAAVELSEIPEENVTYVTFTGAEFVPANVEIKQGDMVVFVNESEENMWVASDPHPAHINLPTFDQFGLGKPGEQYQYTFDEVGTWEFHDHVNPNAVGSVVVTNSVPAADLPAQQNDFGYYETDSEAFSVLVDDPDVTTVNVHVPYGGEIVGTESFVPYNDTEALLAALPEDKSAPVAVYCRSGGMSAVAAKDLVAAGYTNVYDLTGGMNAYRDSGREVIVKN